MNGVCVFLSMCATHWLLNYKFFSYGLQVFSYMESLKSATPLEESRKHDPMCELFPTEVTGETTMRVEVRYWCRLQVSCSIQIGASTGGIDKRNFLCILGNNLFNQKYFLILWVWWVFLLGTAVLGLVYRLARILVPDFSRLGYTNMYDIHCIKYILYPTPNQVVIDEENSRQPAEQR